MMVLLMTSYHLFFITCVGDIKLMVIGALFVFCVVVAIGPNMFKEVGGCFV